MPVPYIVISESLVKKIRLVYDGAATLIFMESLSSAPNSGWISFIKDFWHLLGKYRRAYLWWSCVAFAIFFYQLVPAYLVGMIVDFFTRYSHGGDLGPVYNLILILSVSLGLASFIRLTTKHKLHVLITHVRTDTKISAFNNLLNFSLQWHEQENTGNKVERLTKGLTNLVSLQRLLNQNIYEIITGILGSLLFFLFQDIRLGLFLTVYIFIFLGINRYFYRRQKVLEIDKNIAQEHSSGKYYEGLSNITTLKAHGYGISFQQQIVKAEEDQRNISLALSSLGNNKWKAFQIFNALFTFFFYLIMVQGVVGGTITVGAIFTFHSYFFLVQRSMGNVTDLTDQFLEIKTSFERMMPLLESPQSAFFGTQHFPENWNTIEIRHASFSYQQYDKRFELCDIDFAFQKGQKIGIAGHSGSGKSTFAKLLLGLYKIEAGDFRIGSRDFYDCSHEEVTRHCSLVLQESELFNFSLLENITLLREVTPELLEKAIRISQLDNFISKLPEGLNTLIGEKGYRVSGGERQRIAIARAIAKGPDIFIFDESTSQLDSKTESTLQQALELELKDKTMLFIAHRLSTLRNMDVICVFDQGRIIQKGSFDELINTEGSVFQELYRLQMRKSQV